MKFSIKNIGFLLTTRCNKLCEHCGLLLPRLSKREDMPYEDFLYDIGCTSTTLKNSGKTVMLVGGEPLLHPDFNKIVDDCLKHFPRSSVQITTNGKLMPKFNHLLLTKSRVYFVISHYPGWNDKEVKIFKEHPHVTIFGYGKSWQPDIDLRLTEKEALERSQVCQPGGTLRFFKRRIYYCCVGPLFDEIYGDKYGAHGIKVTKGWEEKFKKFKWWNGCKHCWIASVVSRYDQFSEKTRIIHDSHEAKKGVKVDADA